MTQKIELVNKQAIDYLKSVTEQISSICEPLFKNSPITTCHYSRLFSEGRYLSLTTNSLWGEYMIKCGYQWRTSFFQSELGNLSTDKFRCLLWPSSREDALIQSAAFLGISSGITFAKVKNDFIESYNFAANVDNFSIQLFYINNLPFLEDFMIYFHSKISPFVTNFYPFAISPTKINDLLQNMNTQRPDFSPQELNCIFYLTQGKTAKEIAQRMNLSPRTVEHYIDTLRRKTGYKRRIEIIKFFEQYKINKSFLV